MTAEPPILASGQATPELNAALRVRFDQLLGEYERLKADVAAMRQRLREAEGSAEAPDGSVKLTVGARGELRSLHIDPRAYRRYSPSELAAEIVELSGQATKDVQASLEQVMAPFLPPGLTYQQVAAGEVDPESLRPSQAAMRQLLESWGVG